MDLASAAEVEHAVGRVAGLLDLEQEQVVGGVERPGEDLDRLARLGPVAVEPLGEVLAHAEVGGPRRHLLLCCRSTRCSGDRLRKKLRFDLPGITGRRTARGGVASCK